MKEIQPHTIVPCSSCRMNLKLVYILLFVFLATITWNINTLGQVPATFNYQAVIRDASGTIRADAGVSIELSILHGSASGTEVYSETHSATTNGLGLINLEVGSLHPGDFDDIDWADGPYFIEVSVDGTEMGTSELLSVPYALCAAHVDASGIDAGTLNTGRYSAYDDLEAEGALNNDASGDILTRLQSDVRYNLSVGFLASNSSADNYTTGNEHKVEFNNEIYNGLLMYSNSQDRYTAIVDGVYNFSAVVALTNLDASAIVTLGIYVNGSDYYRLSSCTAGGTTVTLNGSLTIALDASDYVEIYIYSSDVNFTVHGDGTINVTHFSGHLINTIN